MKAEKVILSFVAVFVGLLAAGIAFYLYQATQVIPQDEPQTLSSTDEQQISPTPLEEQTLIVEQPANESVFDKKVIPVSGKTVPGAVVTISTPDSDQVIKPADNGEFSLTQSIPDGTTVMQISAIFPDGTEKKELRTVTYSTEDF